MSATPETLSAILAEMRNPPLGDETPASLACRMFADRVERAAERERDEDRQLAAIAESDEAFARCARCDRPERAPGNAAAMREALTRAKLYFDHRGEGTNLDDAGMAIDAITSIDAALAAPPRNCDRFANWMQAWDGYLAKYPDARQETPFEIGRFHHWLFASAEGCAK